MNNSWTTVLIISAFAGALLYYFTRVKPIENLSNKDTHANDSDSDSECNGEQCRRK